MKTVRLLPSTLVSTLIASAALLTSPTSAVAGMQWKWKDATGAVQYSDRPPPAGTPDKDILTRPAAARATLAATKPLLEAASAATPASTASKPDTKAVDSELEAKRKKAEDEKKAAQKAEEDKAAKNRADNCQRAKSYQRTLNDGVRISRTTANGEREILDDKGRADEQRQVEDIIRNNCK